MDPIKKPTISNKKGDAEKGQASTSTGVVAQSTTTTRRVSTSSKNDDEAGCPSLSFDDDAELVDSYYVNEEDDDDDATAARTGSEIATDSATHKHLEFEFDVEPQSALRETSVQLEFPDVAQHQIVEVFGDDRYGRRVVCVAACRIPTSADVAFSPSRFLQYLLKLLDLYVENDYTLVYFHYGMTRHNRLSSLKWLFQAYRQFDRKYKKNLKALYIVHPTSLIKFVYGMFKSVISYKFGEKIMYIRTLSELAQHIDLSQINIPEPVLEYDAQIVAQYRATHPTAAGATDKLTADNEAEVMQPLETQQFGVSLEFLKAHDPAGQVIPKPIRDAVAHIRQHCMHTKHIFRRSANVRHVREVQAAYNQGRAVHYDEYKDEFLPPVILKTFLRKLPAPILTFEAYEHVMKLPSFPLVADRLFYFRTNIIDKLPQDNFTILKFIMTLLRDVAQTPEIELNAQALAIIFGPNLIWAPQQHHDKDDKRNLLAMDLSALGTINSMTLLLIENYDALFGGDGGSSETA